MSIWASRTQVDCFETDYEPNRLRKEGIDIATSRNGCIRLNIPNTEIPEEVTGWGVDVMLDPKQCQSLIEALQEALDYSLSTGIQGG